MNGLRVAVRCPIGAVLLKMVNFLGGAVYALGRSLPISTMLNPPSKGRVGIRQVCRKPFHKAAFPLDMKSIPPHAQFAKFCVYLGCALRALSPWGFTLPYPLPGKYAGAVGFTLGGIIRSVFRIGAEWAVQLSPLNRSPWSRSFDFFLLAAAARFALAAILLVWSG